MDAAKDEAAGRSRPGTATRRHSAGAGDSSKRVGGDGDGVIAQSSFRLVSTPQRAWSEAIHGHIELSTASTGEATKPSAPMLGGAFSRLASQRRKRAASGERLGRVEVWTDAGTRDERAVPSAPATPGGIGAAGEA